MTPDQSALDALIEAVADRRDDYTWPLLCVENARAELAALRAERDETAGELHRLAKDLCIPDDGPMENRVAAVEMVNALRARVAALEKACEAGDRLEGVASIVCSGCEELKAIVAPELIQSDNQLREVLELNDELKRYRAAREAGR